MAGLVLEAAEEVVEALFHAMVRFLMSSVVATLDLRTFGGGPAGLLGVESVVVEVVDVVDDDVFDVDDDDVPVDVLDFQRSRMAFLSSLVVALLQLTVLDTGDRPEDVVVVLEEEDVEREDVVRVVGESVDVDVVVVVVVDLGMVEYLPYDVVVLVGVVVVVVVVDLVAEVAVFLVFAF